MKKSNLLLIALVLTGLMAMGCKKEGCTDPEALNYNEEANKDCCCEYLTTGSLEFQVAEKVGAEEFRTGQTFQVDGVPTELTHTGFYFSNFTLLSDTGETLITDSYILYNNEDESFTLPEVPVGQYRGIRFYLGIDSTTNYTTLPADYSLGEPLSSQVPIMHWSWNTGYLFLRFDGNVDTTQPPDNTLDDGLAFHIGTQPFLTSVEFSDDFPVDENAATTLSMQIDYEKFFEGIDLSQEYVTHTGDYKALADKFKLNMAKPFSLE